MVKFKKLKILHLLSQRPDSTGSGIYVQAMIREATACGYDNYLVAGVRSDSCDDTECIEQDKSMFVNFHKADVSYHIPGMSDVMPYESTRFCDLSENDLSEYESAFSEIIKNAVRKFKPDIIHSHHLWIVSSMARQLFPDIPMVTTCHGSDLRQFQNCSHLQERVLTGCREIDVVMALSEAQKKDIIRFYNIDPEKIIIAGAGYNDSLFYVESKPDSDPVKLVYAGKLSNAKGVPWLLRALKSISSPAWELHLLGSGTGEEKEHCIMLGKELGEKARFYGALPQESLAEIMRQSHILVLPSFYEGLPLVLLEGLASGCRIVATDLPGTKEILGAHETDIITLVRTPRLHFIDQPCQEDEYSFEQNLKKAIQQQIIAASGCAEIDLSQIQDKIDSYTWTGIFKKVREVYLTCLY
ncbi:MAG: glycosyltransferase family 4 protein [Desulfobacterales bacterium]|jgi:glycosyltransferase involved in cell wall biosynthesis|nr:glycosyltransferase family 4 protein [Desulfobacteraceae bacterium]MBT4363704.1 glycosyltransferase family 4 protein [Desulfobacteraceae bacterium]MBT7085772.1 glycosyltransferase family 4 protein [Desulfobacterales bacterium]MBT7697226.1 glycosyltransferase family 4 protein [Desulfobacterales bacterium]